MTSFYLDDKDSVPCFRNSGIVKLPGRIPRKPSLPILVNERNNFIQPRKTSCPSVRKNLVLKKALEAEIINQPELAEDLKIISRQEIPTLKIQPKTEVVKKVRYSKNKAKKFRFVTILFQCDKTPDCRSQAQVRAGAICPKMSLLWILEF